MRAIQIKTTGGPEVMELVELPTPKPAAGQVLVKIEASGVNFIDTYLREGNPPDQPGCFVGWLYLREPVYAYRIAGGWYDIGDAAQLLEADNRLRVEAGLPPRKSYSLG